MNATSSVVVSLLVGVVAAVGVSIAMQPSQTPIDSLEISALKSSLRDLQIANEELASKVAGLASRPSGAVAPMSK